MTTSEHRPRLLAALDPDRPSSPAAEVAGRLSWQTHALLELVSVAPGDLPGDAVQAFLEGERQHMEGLEVVTTQLTGPDVVGALLSRIQHTRPDLVVLDSHGRTPVGELILGSVSADLVRSSPSPTLLVGPDCRGAADVDRLVVAVDGSDDSKAALDVAVDLAGLLHLELELVEVATGDLGGAPPGDVSEGSELRRLASRTVPPIDRWDVLHGSDVSDAIIDHVDGHRKVLLVLGTHGRSPGRPRVLGGVAARTVRHSPVPVLVVSPEAAERKKQLGSTAALA